MSITLLSGDCRDVLPTLAANSVHCVVTSPPYYGLRDYGTAQWDGGDAACGHVAGMARQDTERETPGGRGGSFRGGEVQYRDTCGKGGARRVDRQIGLEPTPDEYLATMVAVFREVRRVLHPTGSVFCNLGDSYRDKQLQMIPARLAIALQADGWFLRSDIIWHKPNPMPESVTDRPTSAHEHVFLLTRSPRYFYDAEAMREPLQDSTLERGYTATHLTNGGTARERGNTDKMVRQGKGWWDNPYVPAGRNCRNVWTIATHAYPQAHFATYPPELAERCIRAGTSERGCCAACGAPWRRVISQGLGRGAYNDHSLDAVAGMAAPSPNKLNGQQLADARAANPPTTTGWSASCACGADVVPATVLDPFAGAGTTLLVADRLQRNAIGMELNASYTEMAMERVRADAPLFVDTPEPQPVPGFAQPDLFAEAAD